MEAPGRATELVGVKGSVMGQRHSSLVQQMHEALRNGAVGGVDHVGGVAQLHARVRRLQARDDRFAAIKVSCHVEESLPSALSA